MNFKNFFQFPDLFLFLLHSADLNYHNKIENYNFQIGSTLDKNYDDKKCRELL